VPAPPWPFQRLPEPRPLQRPRHHHQRLLDGREVAAAGDHPVEKTDGVLGVVEIVETSHHTPHPWGGTPQAGVEEGGKLLRGGNRTCTPMLASFVAACSSCLTALVPSSTSLVTSLHANGLSFYIRSDQRSGGCCDCESSRFSEKRKGTSTGDRFCFDDFAHGQRLLGAGEGPCGCHSKGARIDLSQGARRQ